MLAGAEQLYRYLYLGRLKRYGAAPTRLNGCAVISVGNLTTGGTGKTPAVQWIAGALHAKGLKVAIVARGYRGSLSAQGTVVSDGSSIAATAEQAGDEPLLHARSLPGIPVLIGRDRVAAAGKAVEMFGSQVIVLDDGYQFWSLRRDLDIVLLDAARPFDNGHLLPAGRLREPIAALGRAGAVLLTRCELATPAQIARTRAQVGELSRAPVYEAEHRAFCLRLETVAGQGSAQTTRDLATLRGANVVVLSALAGNEAFAAALEGLGALVVGRVARGDHHRWRPREVQTAARRALRTRALLVTTEKDAVKIDPAWARPHELWSLPIEMEIHEAAGFMNQLEAVVAGLEAAP